MYDFKDPARLTRAAVAAAWAWAGFDLLFALLHFLDPLPGGPAALAALPRFAALVAFFILGGMWLYRINANAQALGGDVSIGPGWGVGSFLVPFANFVIPYQALAETWLASHELGGLDGESGLPLLRWWWGIWLVLGVLGAIGFALGADTENPSPGEVYVVAIRAVLHLAFCLIFIRLMRRLLEVQRLARAAAAFT